jgi:hypothetical protein
VDWTRAMCYSCTGEIALSIPNLLFPIHGSEWACTSSAVNFVIPQHGISQSSISHTSSAYTCTYQPIGSNRMPGNVHHGTFYYKSFGVCVISKKINKLIQ